MYKLLTLTVLIAVAAALATARPVSPSDFTPVAPVIQEPMTSSNNAAAVAGPTPTASVWTPTAPALITQPPGVNSMMSPSTIQGGSGKGGSVTAQVSPAAGAAVTGGSNNATSDDYSSPTFDLIPAPSSESGVGSAQAADARARSASTRCGPVIVMVMGVVYASLFL